MNKAHFYADDTAGIEAKKKDLEAKGIKYTVKVGGTLGSAGSNSIVEISWEEKR